MKNFSLRIHILFFGILAIALTLCLAFILVDAPHGPKYGIELTFLLLAEVLATAASGVVLEQSDETRPFGAMLVPVSLGYLMFTVAMLVFAASDKFSVPVFLCLHITGIVVTIGLSGLVNMGRHQIHIQSERDRATMAAKKVFSTDALVALEEAKSRFSSCPDLIADMQKFVENLRYAATSRTGSESVDEALAVAVDDLVSCASKGNEGEFEAALKEADRLYRVRQVKIKML